MSAKRVRIGFVGVGAMGQAAHLKNYAINPECEVVAIAEYRPELARRVAAKYGVPRVYPDHKAMLAAEELDGIVASQPFRRHSVLVPDLVEAKVPIFTEKPLAGSMAGAAIILRALEDSGVTHMVGYHKRSDPATMYAKAEIDRLKATSDLGKLRYVRILMPAGDWIAEGFSDTIVSDESLPEMKWEAPPDDMDEKTYHEHTSFVNYYIHQVNLMRHLLGADYRLTYVDKNNVVIVVETEGGVTGTIEMTPFRTTREWHEEALIAFEYGYIKLSLPAPLAANRAGRVELMVDSGDRATPTTMSPVLPWISAMRQQAADFVKVIKGEMQPPCTAEEAMADLAVARDYIRLRLGV